MSRRDMVEQAARRIAAAFGYGGAWHRVDARLEKPAAEQDEQSDKDPVAQLSIRRQTETLIRAGEAMSRSELAKLSPKDRATVKRWSKANPLTGGSVHIGEFEHWAAAKNIAATPRGDIDTTTLGAIGMARWTTVESAWFRMYALQELHHWPTVLNALLRAGHSKVATEDAAARILLPSRRARKAADVDMSQDERAIQLGVRAQTYREQTQRAEVVLLGILERAAEKFNDAIGTANHLAEGVKSRSPRIVASEEPMKPTMQLDAADRARIDKLTRATERLGLLLEYEARPRSPGVLRLKPEALASNVLPISARLGEFGLPLKRAS